MTKTAVWHKNQERCQNNGCHIIVPVVYGNSFFFFFIETATKFKIVFMSICQCPVYGSRIYIQLLSSGLLYSPFYSFNR